MKKGLGRGLDALLPQSGSILETVVQQISIDKLDPNAEQPRRLFQEEALQELANSIRSVGVLSPVLVAEKGQRYQIIAGERRFRAARIAGLETIPCIVKDLSDEQQMEAALIENLQREDLNPIEEAEAIQSLMKDCGYTQQVAAEKLGKSRSALANIVRLATLPTEIKEHVIKGELTSGHARVLCGIGDNQKKLDLAKKTIENQWTVRQLEKAAQEKTSTEKPRVTHDQSPELKQFANHIREVLGMKAKIIGTDQKGKIVLSYTTTQQLEALYFLINEMRNS